MNNEIKLGTLINWVNGERYGSNPFNMIPDCAGIYKIFIKDEDKDKIILGVGRSINGGTLAKATRPAATLQRVYESNLTFDGDGDHVIYIGKAKDLRDRLKKYARMALGVDAKHNGGIDIYAVQNYAQYLYVTYSKLTNDYTDERDWEATEIVKFKQEHGGERPLANRID